MTFDDKREPRSTADSTSPMLWLPPLLVVCVTLAAFLPALNGGFLDWDDSANFVNNPFYRGLGLTQLRWMFTTFLVGPYQPLAWATYGADYLLWGMEPGGYHLTSVILHGVNAALFYFLSLRLLRLSFPSVEEENLRWGAAFSALFFAVHPLRVESVAWVSERRDVVSGIFYLASALCYLRAAAPKGKSAREYVCSLVFYAAALLSKSIGMGFGIILLALDAYPLKRLPFSCRQWGQERYRPVLWEKAPYLALGATGGVIALWGQQQSGAVVSLTRYGPFLRGLQALFGLEFYLFKTAFPTRLSPLYDIPFPVPFMVLSAALIVWGIVYIKRLKLLPALAVAGVNYVVFLAPVLGLVRIGASLTADRYTYLACGGWAVLAGGLWIRLQGQSPRKKFLANAAAFSIVLALARLTWAQTQLWKDSRTLWTHASVIAPEAPIVAGMLGNVFFDEGRYAEAIPYYQKALAASPDFSSPSFNLATAFYRLGRLSEAERQFKLELSQYPDYPLAHGNYGALLKDEGRLAEAERQFQEALRLNPDDDASHFNLGNIFLMQKRWQEAAAQYQEVLRLDPGEKKATLTLAFAQANLRKAKASAR